LLFWPPKSPGGGLKNIKTKKLLLIITNLFYFPEKLKTEQIIKIILQPILKSPSGGFRGPNVKKCTLSTLSSTADSVVLTLDISQRD
jgi:uncharacterized protein YdeI (BOF family)